MKKLITIVAALFLSLGLQKVSAQVQISPYVPEDMIEGLDANAASLLEDRLRDVLSANGIIAKYGESRFVLACKVSVSGKEALPTSPVKIISRLNVHLGIGDGIDGTCYGTTSLELTGVGSTDVQAVSNAVRKINVRNQQIGDMVADATQRIIAYYNQNGSKIVAAATAQMNSGNYDNAIYLLSQIPQECSAFTKAQSIMQQSYKKKCNHEAQQMLTKAQALWSSNPTSDNAAEVVASLSQIDPNAVCYPQVRALLTKIESQGKLEQTREYNLRIKAMNDEVTMEKARLRCIANVANAYAKSQPKVVYRVNYIRGWW